MYTTGTRRADDVAAEGVGANQGFHRQLLETTTSSEVVVYMIQL